MQNHATRFWAITIALLVAIALVVAHQMLGLAVPFATHIEGAAALLLAAFLDALGVERRRTTPGLSAIADDVQRVDDLPPSI